MISNLKLQKARTALYFLERAVADLESGRVPSDPDFDLWRALDELKALQAMDRSVSIYPIDNALPLVTDPATGFSRIGEIE